MLIKFDFLDSKRSFSIELFALFSLVATKVLMENDRNASRTLKVLKAESFLPVKGNTSGPRWQELFKLTRHTRLTNTSIKGANVFTFSPNTLTCCP